MQWNNAEAVVAALCKMARAMGLAGEAVAAQRSLAKQRASAEAQMYTASVGMSASAFQVGLYPCCHAS